MNTKIPASRLRHVFQLTLCFFLITSIQRVSAIDLRKAVLVVSPSIPSPMKETAPQVLAEEVQKRTGVGLKTVTLWPKAPATVIVLALSSDSEVAGAAVPSRRSGESPEFKSEGYRIVTETSPKGNVVWVIGADSRGVLFGIGWLLRNLDMSAGQLQAADKIDVATSPAYPIRGHQLGYRHTANTYDAWTVGQYDQYIRELAIFGSNAVEGIPFQESDAKSPHFKIPSEEMNIRMSEMCRKYDMDYWVWTPATFELKNAKERKEEIERHEAFYKACPRLDHIFFPGGDPGDNHPSEVLPFLKELQGLLVKYHPQAKMWISLQGFSVEQVDYFYQYLEKEKPTWLQGVVSGPGSPPMAETRYRLPKQYQHREYPDITHSIRCEFPVEKFDQAYALTLGRESVNPRPYAFAKIHERYAPFTDGFVSYSDGSHDDVNKVLWSMRAWDPKKNVHEIMTEYATFFFGKNAGKTGASGIEALEQNWKGSLAENGGVETTYLFWKGLEAANPAIKGNWRWQMLLMRAYYDQYTRLRLISEQELEKQANEIMLQANTGNVDEVMAKALALVNKADAAPVDKAIRQHLDDLSDALYISIGFQTSSKHKPRGPERGVVMDFVDYPLNNRWWLHDEFEKIRALKDPGQKVAAVKRIATWENPGAGSYYDDISSVSKGPRVKTFSDDATDVAWWDGGKSRKRLSFQLFQGQPALDYDNLDPHATYIIRVVGSGEALLRVDGYRLSPTIYNRTELDSVKEWILPVSLTADGKIAVTFDKPEESDLNWRRQSKISDIWLLKR